MTQQVSYTYDVNNQRIGETVVSGATTTVERFVFSDGAIAMQLDESPAR